MTSERRKNASRANGTRSKGPKTAEGKAKSSLNAVRHGMLAETILLENEEPRVFKELYYAFMDRLQPADEVERGFIEEMVAFHWRMRRGWLTETELWNRSLEHQPDGPAHHPELGRISLAFSELARSPEMALLNRYESRLHRMLQRSLKSLQSLRETKPPLQPSPQAAAVLPATRPSDAVADAPAAPVEPPAPAAPTTEEPPAEASAPEPPVESKVEATAQPAKLRNGETNLIPKANTSKPTSAEPKKISSMSSYPYRRAKQPDSNPPVTKCQYPSNTGLLTSSQTISP